MRVINKMVPSFYPRNRLEITVGSHILSRLIPFQFQISMRQPHKSASTLHYTRWATVHQFFALSPTHYQANRPIYIAEDRQEIL